VIDVFVSPERSLHGLDSAACFDADEMLALWS
jgi:hypothetical protein